MKVQDIIDMAAYGELRDLNLKEDVPALLSYINLGVLELHKRFTLLSKEYIVELQDNVEIYTMPDDYMWIVAAYGEVPITSTDVVKKLNVNVEDDPLSINTFNWDQVQIPNAIEGNYVSLIYVAKPAMLDATNLQDRLPIPDQLVEALLSYIGYRAHGTINSDLQSESSTFYRKFEDACKRVKLDAVLTSDGLDMGVKFKNRGFV